MKNKIFSLLAVISLTAGVQQCSAQIKVPDMTPGGHAKLTVEKEGEKPVIYTFPDALPADFGCIKRPGSVGYTEIRFTYTFDNGNGKQTLVGVHLRVEPNNVGTFKLNPPMPDKPVPSANITVSIDDGTTRTALMQDPSHGTSGYITINNYPEAVGGNITGTFEATLISQKGALYKVSGEFNIKRKDY
jgi:hypothetical protein